jgi:hypothetical protein
LSALDTLAIVRVRDAFSEEDGMLRLVALGLATYCYLQAGLALAAETDTAKQLVGSWKLNSWVI